MASAGFEESINTFTRAKTGEKIYLDLSTENTVEVRPVYKGGSIPLGVFWVHVFQHPNNYPANSHTYKKLYRAGSKYEIELRVDGISISINLASGKLFMRGYHVLDWFVNRFPGIMEGYSSTPGQTSTDSQKQYTQEELETLQRERDKAYKHFLEDWPMNALEKAANIMDAGKKSETLEPVDPVGFLKGQDLETHHPHADLISEEETLDQLQRLEHGRVIQGNVLYRLWRSVLNQWFSEKGGRVFLVTPHIDCDRLTDVCTLFLNNKLTAHLETMCIPINNLRERFADVRRDTLKRFPQRDQVFIEYKIYSSLVYPVLDFTTSFVAMAKEGKVQILQTNTTFTREAFITTRSATVQYKVTDEGQFLESFLDPILV